MAEAGRSKLSRLWLSRVGPVHIREWHSTAWNIRGSRSRI